MSAVMACRGGISRHRATPPPHLGGWWSDPVGRGGFSGAGPDANPTPPHPTQIRVPSWVVMAFWVLVDSVGDFTVDPGTPSDNQCVVRDGCLGGSGRPCRCPPGWGCMPSLATNVLSMMAAWGNPAGHVEVHRPGVACLLIFFGVHVMWHPASRPYRGAGSSVDPSKKVSLAAFMVAER